MEPPAKQPPPCIDIDVDDGEDEAGASASTVRRVDHYAPASPSSANQNVRPVAYTSVDDELPLDGSGNRLYHLRQPFSTWFSGFIQFHPSNQL